MKSYLLDTNVLLRYLLADIPSHTKKAKYYFNEAKENRITLKISILVFVEALFTLTRFYDLPKAEVAEKLHAIAQISYLDVEKRDILIAALNTYATKSVSFIDLLLFFEAKASGIPLVTFDRKLSAL